MALGLTPQQIVDKGTHPLLGIKKDWRRIQLQEIAEVQNGYAFKSTFFTQDEGVPLIRIRDINSKDTDHFYNGDYDDSYIVRKNDVLIGMDGDFNVTKWPGEMGLLNQRVCRIKCDTAVYDEDFLFYVLQPYLNAVHAETSAVTVKHLSSKTIKALPIPLPPLPEQRAIVAKLERLFAELDRSVAELETAREKLGVYRQSVLKEAFGGRLTAGWRSQKISEEKDLIGLINEHLQHSYESNLAKYSKQVMDWNNSGKIGKGPDKPKRPTKITQLVGRDGKPKPIVSKMPLFLKVGDLCAVVRGGSPRPAGDPRYYDGDIPFLKVADLTREPGKYVTKFNYTIKEAGLQKTRRLTAGTLVISNSGATLGVPKILHINATANDGIAAFLHLPEEYIPFMYYFWVSQTEKLRNINQGAAQPNLNTNMLRDYLIPVFSLREQNKIVEEIETRFSVADKLEQEIAESLERARGLRQGVLKRAFAGELFK